MNFWANFQFQSYQHPSTASQHPYPAPYAIYYHNPFAVPVMIQADQNPNSHPLTIPQPAQQRQIVSEHSEIPNQHQQINKEEPRKLKSRTREQDPDYIKRDKRIIKKIEQIPGRNKISNVFRVFFKLTLSPAYRPIISEKVKSIVKSNKIDMTPTQFIYLLIERAPSCSNYINISEFKRVYFSGGDFGKILRILFQTFLNKESIAHIYTVSNRKKVLAENKVKFLGGLREVKTMLSESSGNMSKGSVS